MLPRGARLSVRRLAYAGFRFLHSRTAWVGCFRGFTHMDMLNGRHEHQKEQFPRQPCTRFGQPTLLLVCGTWLAALMLLLFCGTWLAALTETHFAYSGTRAILDSQRLARWITRRFRRHITLFADRPLPTDWSACGKLWNPSGGWISNISRVSATST